MNEEHGPRRDRRRFLRGAAVGASTALAGCFGDADEDDESAGDGDDGADGEDDAADGGDTDDENGPALPVVEDPPEAVYLPTHRDEMIPLERISVGDYEIAPAVSYAHRFHTVTNREAEPAEPTAEDDVHLMVTAWDPESRLVVPLDASASFEIYRDGESIATVNPWPMLSQAMGFHFGDNVPLDGDGTYRVEGRIGALDVRKTGTVADRFEESVSFEFEFEYGDEVRDLVLEIEYFDEDRWGEPGALDPMGHSDHDEEMDDHDDGESDHDDSEGNDDEGEGDHDDHGDGTDGHPPYSAFPPAEDLPGTLQGTPETGDGVFAITLLEPGSRFVEADEWYLAVSPRTPYNRCVLPMMGLEATHEGADGTRTVDLVETLDHELDYHYGAPLEAVDAGDEVTIEVLAPPQVARHQGYDTAFLEMPPVTIELDP